MGTFSVRFPGLTCEVANIAQNLLEESSQSSLDQALLTLSYLRVYNETLTYHEGDHPYVEVATFADDVKYHGHAW